VPSGQELEPSIASMRSELEGVVAEQVLAYGLFRRPGVNERSSAPDAPYGVGGAGLGGLLRRAVWKGDRLPREFYLAVTPTRICAVRYKVRHAAIRPCDVVRSWDRGSTRIEIEGPSNGHEEIVTLTGPSGERVQVEVVARGGHSTGAVLELLRS
jgi:hypothetical protein